MDPLTLVLIAGGALLWLNGKKGKKKPSAPKPSGDYPIHVGEEMELKLPRAGGFWSTTPIGTPAGVIQVFAHAGDPLDILRVRGKGVGTVKLQVYSDEPHTDLVSEFVFQVIPQTTSLKRN